jgi:hypothetical protein
MCEKYTNPCYQAIKRSSAPAPLALTLPVSDSDTTLGHPKPGLQLQAVRAVVTLDDLTGQEIALFFRFDSDFGPYFYL